MNAFTRSVVPAAVLCATVLGAVVPATAASAATVPAASTKATAPSSSTPAAPEIVSFDADRGTLLVLGSAPNGSVVTFETSFRQSEITTVRADGRYSMRFSGVPTSGEQTIRAVIQNGSGTTRSQALMFDMAELGKPAVAVTPTIRVVQNTDGRIEFAGTGRPGAVLDLAHDVPGLAMPKVTVGSDGTWSGALNDVPAGTYSVRVQSFTSGVEVSSSVDFTVSRQAPPAVDVRPLTATARVQGSTVTVTGTGDPGRELTVNSSARNVHGSVTIGQDGTYSQTFTDVASGTYELSVRDWKRFDFVDDVSFTVGSAAAAPFTATVSSVDAAARTAVLTGTGTAGSTVTLTLDGRYPTIAVRTVVAPNGTWSARVGQLLPNWQNGVTATAANGATVRVTASTVS